MSITATNQYYLTTAPNGLLNNVASCSLSFFWRYDGDPTAAGGLRILSREFQGTFTCYASPNDANSVKLKFAISNAAGSQVTDEQIYERNTIYHLAVTYTSGSQVVWVNGVSTTLGTLTGNTQDTGSHYWAVGSPFNPLPGAQFTIDNVAIWHGYVLTSSDVAAIRDGAPASSIGGGATLRVNWSLSGSIGSAPQIGDIALANTFGDTTYDLTAINGTGSGIYSGSLEFIANADIGIAYVSTSGKMIAIFFESLTTGLETTLLSLIRAPTLYKNGVSLGQLINPWFSGVHRCIMYQFPAGTSAIATDSLTLSAPIAWANTTVGVTAALNSKPIGNYAGKSVVGSDTLVKTLRMGMNLPAPATNNYAPYTASKNLWKRGNRFSHSVTWTPDGHTLTMSQRDGTTQLIATGQDNGIDATTYPVKTGLYAIGWDGNTSTTFTLSTNANGTATERSDLANTGDANGIGKVRIFDIQYAVSPASLDLQLFLNIDDASLSPVFTNAVVYGPGDFTATAPVVLDRTDPLALGQVFLSRFANGLGCLRFMDSTLGPAGTTFAAEPEDMRTGSDFVWYGQKTSRTVGFSQARKCDPAVSPWIYSAILGSPYTVILAAPIDAVTTTLNITEDPANPVIAGLTLTLGSEVCRIFDVTGPTVTVERGSESTTPAAHAAGPIQITGRFAFTGLDMFGADLIRWTEWVTSTPHRLQTGQAAINGTFPRITYSDGSYLDPSGYFKAVWVTGQTTFMTCHNANPNSSVNVTMGNTPVTLLPGTNYDTYTFPNDSTYPYEFCAHAASQFTACDLWVNVPQLASNTLVDWIATNVRDNLATARNVFVEVSNEQWNVGFTQSQFFRYANAIRHPGGFGPEYITERTAQVVSRFKAIFNAGGRNRGSEIKSVLNMQPGSTDTAHALDFANRSGLTVDAIANGMYITPHNSAISRASWFAADDEQAIDLLIHDMYYGTYNDNVIGWFTSTSGQITAANAAYHTNTIFMGYEGGIQAAVQSAQSSLAANITDPAATSISVTDGTYFAANVYAIVDSEWILVQSVNGNTLTVARAQLGTTGATHSSGSTLRTTYRERNRDLVYNPNWYIAEQDFYAMCQNNGMHGMCLYGYAFQYYQKIYLWGLWHWDGHVTGRGNGSDGKHDNRLTLARPGLTNTKSAIVNLDEINVSVRGQAFADWMKVGVPIGGVPTMITIDPLGVTIVPVPSNSSISIDPDGATLILA